MDKRLFKGLAAEALTLLALVTAGRPLLSLGVRLGGMALIAWLNDDDPETAVRLRVLDEATQPGA
jgi:hypothetical protein